jgi:hypothetical protein
MTKVRTWVGLDVHAAKVVACVVDALSGEMSVHRLPGETSALVAFCAGLPGATRVAYEAGPTGFGLGACAHEFRDWVCDRGAGKDRASLRGPGQNRPA